MVAPHRELIPDNGNVSGADHEVAEDLLSILETRSACERFELRGEHGRVATVSAPMLALIERAARIVAEGSQVEVLARDQELTSQEAASLLDVSRQYLVRLLDRGEIPFTRTGNHRRIRAADLAAFRARRDAARRAALAALTADAQASGGCAAPGSFGPPRK